MIVVIVIIPKKSIAHAAHTLVGITDRHDL